MQARIFFSSLVSQCTRYPRVPFMNYHQLRDHHFKFLPEICWTLPAPLPFSRMQYMEPQRQLPCRVSNDFARAGLLEKYNYCPWVSLGIPVEVLHTLRIPTRGCAFVYDDAHRSGILCSRGVCVCVYVCVLCVCVCVRQCPPPLIRLSCFNIWMCGK